ncbi:MAG: response regulator [Deltaproteobacteria bacterium]|nr:response regulator [Deltaproteobacteria bacterium]
MSQVILSVDDSKSIRQMVRFTLTQAGYEVLSAENGEEALAVVADNPVDMVIADLYMPVMDGIEMTRRMRALPATKYTPIVLLTTASQEDKKKEGREAGATGWIVKPFKPEQLLKVVKKVME